MSTWITAARSFSAIEIQLLAINIYGCFSYTEASVGSCSRLVFHCGNHKMFLKGCYYGAQSQPCPLRLCWGSCSCVGTLKLDWWPLKRTTGVQLDPTCNCVHIELLVEKQDHNSRLYSDAVSIHHDLFGSPGLASKTAQSAAMSQHTHTHVLVVSVVQFKYLPK